MNTSNESSIGFIMAIRSDAKPEISGLLRFNSAGDLLRCAFEIAEQCPDIAISFLIRPK